MEINNIIRTGAAESPDISEITISLPLSVLTDEEQIAVLVLYVREKREK